MFEVVTLGSGSAGNATLIRSGATAFLVDAGLSAKQLVGRLASCGIAPGDLQGVLLTHEHSDHAGALRVLLARHPVPVYCNSLTARTLQQDGLEHRTWRLFQNGSAFAVGEFTVQAFSVPHDAVDPVGFRIETRGVSFGVLTDLGHATRLVFEMLRGVRGLLIETNHDEDLLERDSRRPWSVKQRIRSRHGHLSNAAAARVVAELDASLDHLVLGHLSRDCNSPQIAADTVRTTLETAGRAPRLGLHCASQDTPGPVLGFSLG